MFWLGTLGLLGPGPKVLGAKHISNPDVAGHFSYNLRLTGHAAWSCRSVLDEASSRVAIGTTPARMTAHVLSDVPAEMLASAFAASLCVEGKKKKKTKKAWEHNEYGRSIAHLHMHITRCLLLRG